MKACSKSYSFYFNAAAWLASPVVRSMSKAERGVYICLLALAWESQNQLPAEPDKVRRLAEMSTAEWAESGAILLEQFPVSACGTYRYNPRLQQEVDKEAASRQRQQQRANSRWQSRGNAVASKTDAVASKNVCHGNAQEQEQESTNVDDVREDSSSSAVLPTPPPATANDVAGRPPAAPDPAKAHALAVTDQADELPAAAGPLGKPHGFRAICEALGHGDIDCEHYRRLALLAAEGTTRTAPQWRSWVGKFLTNQLKSGPLLKASQGEAARVGLHAPQYADAYEHRVAPDIAARRAAEKAASDAARIQANYARHAAEAWPTAHAAA